MERIGDYELRSLIGEGGMGEVWHAHDLKRERDVALKLLPASLSEDPEYQRRFRRESYLVARLREPHLIPIHDYGEIDGRLFIDMRMVDGRSMDALLTQEGRLTPGRTVALVAQIADALDAAHADGLVHRDVKPSNVLVTKHDFVYVVDFGLAYSVGGPRTKLTMTGVTVGTLEYMAPERFSNRPLDKRTDVYSLACLLFECLTTHKPYPGDFPTQMYGHLNLEPPRPSERVPDVPVALDAVVARGMAKDPEDRFATAGDLAVAAREAVRPTPAKPAKPAITQPAQPADRGSPSDRTTTMTTGSPVAPHPGRGPTDGPSPVAVASGPMSRGPKDPHPSGPAPAKPKDPHPSGPTPGGPRPVLWTPPEPPATPPSASRLRPGVLLAAVALLAVIAVVVAVLLAGGSADTGRPLPGPPPAAAVAQPTVAATVPVRATPGSMAIAPGGRFAYIAGRDAGEITVFDTARGVTTGTIAVPDGAPQFVAFSSDGRRAYVSVVGAVDGVDVVDTVTGTMVAHVPTGKGPLAPATSPDGRRVYVPDGDAGSVTAIDTATNSVATTIQVASNPHGLAFSPDGTRLAVTDYESNLITMIDTSTDRVLGTTPVGRSPHGVVWDRTRPWVFATNFVDNTVSVVDVRAGSVVATVPTATHPQAIALSADGRYAYVAAVDANKVQVIDTTTFAVTATIPTGLVPSSIAVAPDGRRAYVTNLLDGTLTVLNVAGP